MDANPSSLTLDQFSIRCTLCLNIVQVKCIKLRFLILRISIFRCTLCLNIVQVTCIKLCFDQLALIIFQIKSSNRLTSVNQISFPCTSYKHSSNQISFQFTIQKYKFKTTNILFKLPNEAATTSTNFRNASREK